jgi:manganese transport protein
MSRFREYWRQCGPGFLQSALTLGAGTAASSLYAGALYGYGLLWVAPVAILIGVAALAAVAQQSLATDERPLAAMRRRAGPFFAWAWAGGALLASVIWHFPQYNLAAASLVDVAEVAGAPALHPGAASGIVLVWAVLLSFTYGKDARWVRIYERVLKWMVWLIVVALAWVVAHTVTDWGAVARGFVPFRFPDATAGSPSSVQVALSGLAAAVGINMVFLYPYSLRARGWRAEQTGLARFDLLFGMALPYAIATSLLVIATANVLHASGTGLELKAAIGTTTRVLGDVIGPVSGRVLFDLGMLAMALSSITLHMVVCGLVAMEVFGLPFGSRAHRLWTLLPIPGALAPFVWADYAVYLALPTSIACGALLPLAWFGFARGETSRSGRCALLLAAGVMLAGLGLLLWQNRG